MANSVLAPMPCKVLRVEVKEGAKVTKDQVLVVIESMKMETQIKSPQDGIVAKIVHRQGVSYGVRTYVDGLADKIRRCVRLVRLWWNSRASGLVGLRRWEYLGYSMFA